MRETPAPSSVCTRTQVRTARASEVKVQGQFSARWRMHSTGNETTRRHRSCLSLYLSANAVHVVAPLKSCAKPRARRIAMVLETFYVAKRAARWPSWAGGDGTFGCETILRKLPRTLQACTNAAHTHTHTRHDILANHPFIGVYKFCIILTYNDRFVCEEFVGLGVGRGGGGVRMGCLCVHINMYVIS